MVHDPMTVVFQIRYPWPWPRQNWGRERAPRETVVTIWHVDPETDGTNDSCDWFGRRLSPAERVEAHDLWTNAVDNLRSYLEGMHEADRAMLLEAQWRHARRFYRPRPWWRHPRWHVHHWQVQVHPIQALQRWLFSRCAACGQRFSWGYSPVSFSWGGDGPRWFRGERGVYHHDCTQPGNQVAKMAATAGAA